MDHWHIDVAHSEICFKVKHLMISTVTGCFRNYSISLTSEGSNFNNARVLATIDAASISTNHSQRDKHLTSSDFFDTDHFPEISFESTSMAKTCLNGDFTLKGNLTIKNTMIPVTLDVEFLGLVRDVQGNTKAGFAAFATISRAQFGLSWNALTTSGALVVGDDIKIVCNTQFIKQCSANHTNKSIHQ